MFFFIFFDYFYRFKCLETSCRKISLNKKII
uniref:Uncharacterized protein n=1 Tax=Magnetospirillum gryphiswaldense TaxID=55518 RepID=A4U1S6_9PROT|nr:hypothetical protein MGR_3017 [Magnetospirillum gryphiswaldense MSR-1]